MASPHSLDLHKHGDIVLRDGVLYLTKDGEDLGRILVGPDGLTIDGCELAIAQKGDPAALSFITSGNRGSGKLTFKEARSDGRGDEVAFLHGGLAEDAAPGSGDLRGQIAIHVRPETSGEPERAFVATTHDTEPRRIWTGLRNDVGWLKNFAYTGDDRPTVAPSGTIWELRHPDGIHWCVQQGDGNFVGYKNRVPFDYATGDPVFDWFTIQYRLNQLAASEARIAALEARALALERNQQPPVP